MDFLTTGDGGKLLGDFLLAAKTVIADSGVSDLVGACCILIIGVSIKFEPAPYHDKVSCVKNISVHVKKQQIFH